MKTSYLKTVATFLGIASLAISTLAQETASTQPAPAYAPAPQVGYGVSQVLQLQQANVGDDTIIAYIKNSGNSYGLNAEQIIYLRQQGLSSAVLNTMLTQPATAVAAPPSPGSESVVATSVPTDAVIYTSHPRVSIVGPSVSAIDPSAAAAASYSYYAYPPTYYSSYTPYYYPAYGFYPSVSVAWGVHGGWHGGSFCGPYGGFHGGFHGGWHH